MKHISLRLTVGVEQILFPDGQPHLRVTDVVRDDKVHVTAPIRSSLELVHLMMVSSALDGLGAQKTVLTIPYLMGARYDRRMKVGDSFDLEVVANAINACGFGRIEIFDPHSAVSTDLIYNSSAISNRKLVESYQQEDAVLIVPDKGAKAKGAEYFAWNPLLKDVVFCAKERDGEGRVTLRVIESDKCHNRNCVIIDDICDGGATFLAIAEQIKPAHLTLIVSHGIFSKGFQKLKEHFAEIITTDSFALHARDKVTGLCT